MTDNSWIEIGTIVAPQGLDGELRVYSNSDFPERFLEPGTRWLQSPKAAEPQPVTLLGGRFVPGKGLYVVELEGVETREQAEDLRDFKLLVPMSDRPTLEEDEYHVIDLIDLEVVNQLTGEPIGVVVDIIAAGNDLLEVKLHKQPVLEAASDKPIPNRVSKKRQHQQKQKPIKPATVLIPFVKEIVPVVNLEAGRIEIAPPPGLLDSVEIA